MIELLEDLLQVIESHRHRASIEEVFGATCTLKRIIEFKLTDTIMDMQNDK